MRQEKRKQKNREMGIYDYEVDLDHIVHHKMWSKWLRDLQDSILESEIKRNALKNQGEAVDEESPWGSIYS